jgi:hypothetical protein
VCPRRLRSVERAPAEPPTPPGTLPNAPNSPMPQEETGGEDGRGTAGKTPVETEGEGGGGSGENRRDGHDARHVSDTSPVRLRRECAPDTRPEYARRALKYRGRRPDTPPPAGLIFGQIPARQTASNTLRTGSAYHRTVAQSGRRSTPPGPFRRPRGCRRRCPPAHWIQYSGPTHATTMEPLPRWPEKSARTGARPHTGSTPQQPVSEPHFSTDHNPANRNNAP